MGASWSTSLYLSIWISVLSCAMATNAGTAVAQSRDSQSSSQQALQDVTVTAHRLNEHRALERAVSSFVASHSAPAARTSQIGRWREPVCPLVTGLQPTGRDFITREILNVARGVGAPTGSAGKKCEVTVEIVFTLEPQALLDRIANAYRPMLGFYPVSHVKQMTTFSRPIQAWYETGSRSMDTQNATIEGFGASQSPLFAEGKPGNTDFPIFSGRQIDSDVTAMGAQPAGVAGSYLGHQVSSEFVHVLIIADSGQLASYSMQSIADYIALLSLSRMAQLDQCGPLPSITDLLANGCPAPVADSLTAADRAYLKGLYSADLEKNLNIERGAIREQMMQQIEGK
jgi:hypothetical protein